MGTVAERINLPNYFVVLRNDIAHMDLPSLVRFEQAAPEALLWLWNRHWSKLDDTNFDVRRTLFPGDHPYNEQANDPDAMVDGQDDEHNDPDAMVDDLQNAMLNPKTTQSNHATSDRKREEEISVVLNTFRTDRKKEIAAGVIKQGKKSASAIGCAALCKICCQDMDTTANTMGMIARELVKERLMIPAKRQEGDSMEGAFFMWSNLLQRMTVYEAGFLRTLLETLVGIVIAPGLVGAYQEAVAKWVVEIVMWETRGAGAKDDHRGYVLNRCLSYPRHYPRQIVVEIGDEAGGDLQEIMEELLDMSPSV
jgi:ribosomal biogenesis protein LAS1